MLLDSAVATETNCILPSKEFSIKASPVAFDILSSKLYSDPILAIVRELLTNAYDSHKAADNLETPIHLNIPNYMNQNLIIRDYGTGLSKEDVLTLYTTFFDSTKSSSNDFTGCFGLGSKTPFSYTSSFTVNSYFNGTKYNFIATKKNGYPNIIQIKEESTEEHNGLEITIPVNDLYDANKFAETIKKYLARMPEIIVDAEVPRDKPEIVLSNIKCYPNDKWYGVKSGRVEGISIKQGQNIYNIDSIISNMILNEDADIKKFIVVCILSCKFDIEIEVPIGTFGITPNREQLSVSDDNTPKILQLLIDASATLKEYMNEHCDKLHDASLSKAFRELKNQMIEDKYFSDRLYVTASLSSTYSNECTVAVIKSNDLKCFNISTYSNSREGPGFLTTKNKNLIILAPAEYKYPTYRKLWYTLNNYLEDLEDINIVLIQMPMLRKVYRDPSGGYTKDNIAYYETYQYDLKYLKFVRAFHNIIWMLQNMSEYDFDIDVITVSKFMREHPNHCKPKDFSEERKNREKIDEHSTYIRSKYIKFDKNRDFSYSIWNTVSSEDTISVTKQRHPYNQTIVILNDDLAKSHIYNSRDLCENTLRVMSQLKNLDGVSLLKKFATKILAKYNITDNNLEYITFLRIGKTNKKFFKQDYQCITVQDLHDFIKTEKFRIAANESNWNRQDISTILKCTERSFKGKMYDMIVNTSIYKKMKLIDRVISKFNIVSQWNSTAGLDTITDTLNVILGNSNKYTFNLNINSKVYDKFRVLDDKIFNRTRHFNGTSVLTNDGKNRLLYFLFSKEKEHAVL